MKRKIVLILATGFGLGLSPVASGTVGSILGVAIVIGMAHMGLMWQILLSAVLVVISIPICGAAENIYEKKDDGRIVADEYLTYPLCMLGLPWMMNPWLLGVGFVTNRVLDIIKPPPAMQAQNLHGGIGIVCDDVISSLYALALNHGIFWLACKYGFAA